MNEYGRESSRNREVSPREVVEFELEGRRLHLRENYFSFSPGLLLKIQTPPMFFLLFFLALTQAQLNLPVAPCYGPLDFNKELSTQAPLPQEIWNTSIAYDLTGKNAVIIGGSRGMGRATAVRLAQAGVNVLSVARSVAADFDPVPGVPPGNVGGKITEIRLDIRNPLAGDIIKTVINVLPKFNGKVHILILNAATGYLGRARDTTYGDIINLFANNFIGHHQIYQRLYDNIVFEDGYEPRVMATSSQVYHNLWVFRSLYNFSKWLIAEMLAQYRAENSARFDKPIVYATIHPSGTQTLFGNNQFNPKDDECPSRTLETFCNQRNFLLNFGQPTTRIAEVYYQLATLPKSVMDQLDMRFFVQAEKAANCQPDFPGNGGVVPPGPPCNGDPNTPPNDWQRFPIPYEQLKVIPYQECTNTSFWIPFNNAIQVMDPCVPVEIPSDCGGCPMNCLGQPMNPYNNHPPFDQEMKKKQPWWLDQNPLASGQYLRMGEAQKARLIREYLRENKLK